jgi:hypothetical protein
LRPGIIPLQFVMHTIFQIPYLLPLMKAVC